MKKLLLGLLLLSGCSSLSLSDAIRRDAAYACKDTPELDGQRLYCEYNQIFMDCLINKWDAKICGDLEKK